MALKVTDTWLRGLRAKERKQEYRDETCPRLYVVVQPLGGRSRLKPTIAFLYRVSIGGKDYKRSLGRYPSVSYAEAREAAWELSREVDALRNPFVAAPSTPQKTVKEAFERYMEKEGNSRKTAAEKRAIFERELRSLHDRPIQDVTADDIEGIIAEKDEQFPQAARKLLAITKRFFKWSATRGRRFTGLRRNPAADIEPMSDAVARDRSLGDDELRWLLRSLPKAGATIRRSDDMPTDEFPPIYELLLRTMMRKDEAFGLLKGWVRCGSNGDPEKIILPDSKGDRPFAIWLHPSAAALLRGRIDGHPDERVFRAHPCERPLNRVRKAMSALAMKDRREIERWSLHDFRQSANDALAAMLDEDDQPLVSAYIRDRLLNHADPSVRGKHYESHDYYAERKRALRLWNEHLNRLLAPAMRQAA